jgi:hypothetical protein
MSMNAEKLILLDADVISHFIRGNRFDLLPSIFAIKKVILNVVVDEIRGHIKFKAIIEKSIADKSIHVLPFPNDSQFIAEYARLIRTYGKGESACMAYCRFSKDILASSNLKDIAKYCEDNGITYLTTMDFIAEALRTQQLSETECNGFIWVVKTSGSKLPVNKINEYLEHYKVRKI